MLIRPAEAQDGEAIDGLLRRSFPRPAEAELVGQLAQDGDLILVLAAFDEAEGQLAGIVVFSRMHVEMDDRPVAAAALAPLAVLREYRGSGVADTLVRAGLEKLTDAGLGLVFVLGDPDYYSRFGFDAAIADGFVSPYAGPYFMARSLQGPMPPGKRGHADHAGAFAALSEDQ